MNKFESTGTSYTTINHQRQRTTFIPLRFVKRSGRSTVIQPEEALNPKEPGTPLPDTILLRGLAKAFYWQRLIDRALVKSGTEIARKEKLDLATVNEHLRLTLLDPRIIQDILSGTQPEGLTLNLLTTNPIPWEWSEQRLKYHSLTTPQEVPLGLRQK
jgi:hypothetical protein